MNMLDIDEGDDIAPPNVQRCHKSSGAFDTAHVTKLEANKHTVVIHYKGWCTVCGHPLDLDIYWISWGIGAHFEADVL